MKNNLQITSKSVKAKKVVLISLVMGIAIGTSFTISQGTFFIIILASICGFFVIKSTPKSEKKFVTWVFIIGLLLRMSMSVALDMSALIYFKEATMQEVAQKNPPDTNPDRLIKEKIRSFYKMPDSDYYSMRGYVYAAHVKGFDNIIVKHYLGPRGLEYGWSGYLHIIGLFYYLFGYSPISVKFLNCLIGVLTAVFIYKISLNFNKKTAKIAFSLSIFFPSLIIWSTTNFKDPILSLLSAVSIWAFINFLKNKKIRYLALSFLCIPILPYFTKMELWLILMASIFLTFAVMLYIQKKGLFILVLGIVLFVVLIAFQQQDISIKTQIRRIYGNHIGHIHTGGIVYKVLDDKYYDQPDLLYEMGAMEFAYSSIKSLAHFLFEPFPNRMINSSLFLFYMQIILWYLFLFLAGIGLLRSLVYGYKSYLPLLIFLTLGTIAVALASGNVGTLFRHRDILSPFYFIFTGLGIAYFFGLEHDKK